MSWPSCTYVVNLVIRGAVHVGTTDWWAWPVTPRSSSRNPRVPPVTYATLRCSVRRSRLVSFPQIQWVSAWLAFTYADVTSKRSRPGDAWSARVWKGHPSDIITTPVPEERPAAFFSLSTLVRRTLRCQLHSLPRPSTSPRRTRLRSRREQGRLFHVNKFDHARLGRREQQGT
jgi:hypothetical protein